MNRRLPLAAFLLVTASCVTTRQLPRSIVFCHPPGSPLDAENRIECRFSGSGGAMCIVEHLRNDPSEERGWTEDYKMLLVVSHDGRPVVLESEAPYPIGSFRLQYGTSTSTPEVILDGQRMPLLSAWQFLSARDSRFELRHIPPPERKDPNIYVDHISGSRIRLPEKVQVNVRIQK